MNSSGLISFESLTVDSDGNLYATGYRGGAALTLRNLDTSASTSAYSLPTPTGGSDAFLIKYNSSGSVVAYSYINGTSADSEKSLTVDSGGNLYATGFYQSTGTVTLRNLDTTASASSYTLPISTGQDAFLIKYNTGGLPAIPSAPVNTWTHVAASYDGSTLWVGSAGRMAPTTPATALTFNTDYSTQIGGTFSRGQISGNLADVRVSNVARYTGSTYTVPTEPHPTNNANTLLLLRSLAGQVGTTLEVQGRGLNAVSLGATRSVQSYPPAPMSSYLLDTTSNVSVTYGQGKYVASASGDNGSANQVWTLFDNGSSYWYTGNGSDYGPSSPYLYNGTITTVDVLGSAYKGQWAQIQLPVSVVLSNYTFTGLAPTTNPTIWVILGSRDGSNWTLVDSRNIGTFTVASLTFQTSVTQAYNYFRVVVLATGLSSYLQMSQWTLNGTEESLCITSDAKVGVGIANPQRALEVAGDLVVSGTISGGAGLGSFRNRIINGDMRIAQRGTSNVVVNGVNNVYGSLDRWKTSATWSAGQLTITRQTLAASDNPYQSGLQYSLRCTVNTGLTGFNYFYINQAVELLNIIDLNLGTPFGSPFTVSFWFRSNIPAGSIISAAIQTYVAPGNISYVTDFKTTGTWQYVTFTVPPMATTLGVLSTDNFLLAIGSLNTQAGFVTPASNVNTWASSINSVGSAAMYPWWQNAGNYIELTGVQLEKGTVATGFEFRNYAQELALCQRYFQKSYSIATAPGTATESGNWAYYLPVAIGSTNNWIQSGPVLQVSMRTAPAIVLYNSAGNVTTAWNALDGSTATAWRYLNNTSGGSLGPAFLGYGWTASAEL
jgi:hypothetical protein